jgi:hypothetical protein
MRAQIAYDSNLAVVSMDRIGSMTARLDTAHLE